MSCETNAKPYEFHMEGQNEAEILRDLYHPNIINIFEVFDEPRRLYIFEELCLGGTLSDMLYHAPFPEREVAQFTRNMLISLRYMHSHGVAHRAINPFNICFYQS